MRNHNSGKFYRGLRELGVTLEERSMRGRTEYSPEDLKARFECLGKEASIVSDEVLSRLPPDRKEEKSLDDEPSYEEIAFS